MYGVSQVGIACCFHVFDLLTGIIGAVREHNLESAKMRDGLFKKVGFLCCYALAILLDTQALTIGLTLNVKVLPVIVVYAVTTEIISILENISKINPDLLPNKLMDLFHIKKEEGEEDAGHTEGD